jgi:hypothetical protein
MARKGRRRKDEPPAYNRHKASNQAYVTIGGITTYLGVYGSSESRRRYRAIVEQWERDHEANRKPFIAGVGCTVAALVAAHSEHARTYYRRPDGSQTSEVEGFRRSTRPLLGEEYRELPADEFKPTHLRAIREKLIGLGQCRNTINQSIGRIRRVFRWGFESDLVKQESVVALSRSRTWPRVAARRRTTSQLPLPRLATSRLSSNTFTRSSRPWSAFSSSPVPDRPRSARCAETRSTKKASSAPVAA